MYNLIPSVAYTRFAKSGDAERFNNGYVAAAAAAAVRCRAPLEERTQEVRMKKKIARNATSGCAETVRLVVSCNAKNVSILFKFGV